MQHCKIYVFWLVFVFFHPSFTQENNAGAYFPLKVGNKWQYQIYNYDFYRNYITYHTVEVLKDTILSNGKTYYYLSGFGDLLDPKEPSLIRTDSSEAKIFHSCSLLENYNEYCQDNEFCFYDLGLPDSTASYSFCEDESSCYAEYNVGFGQVGKLADSTRFKSFWFFPGGVGINRVFSENFGISEWAMGEGNAGAHAYLVYAQINGKQFGNYVTNIEKKTSSLNFKLEQNYPNPFNNSTTISYTINKPGNVKINIYNISGQLIRTMVNRFQNIGHYSDSFSAQNISSGLYFYQLEIDSDKSEIKKIVYIR